VTNSVLKALTATAVVVAVSAFAFGVSAQQPKPCETYKDAAACKAREDCAWTAATKKGSKGHCMKPAPKKEAPKKDDKKK
jgi:hypothetical protein